MEGDAVKLDAVKLVTVDTIDDIVRDLEREEIIDLLKATVKLCAQYKKIADLYFANMESGI